MEDLIIKILQKNVPLITATRRKDEGDSSGSSRYVFIYFPTVPNTRLFFCRRLFVLASVSLSSRPPPFKSQAHCETKPRQLEQSSYQTIAANYLIFRSSDGLPGAARPLSPAADVQTTPPPPHTPTARLRPESHPADDPPLPPPPLGERESPPPPSAPPAYESL